MSVVTVLIFHRPAAEGDGELARILADVRERLAERHRSAFLRAGAERVDVVTDWPAGRSFGAVLASMAPRRGGVVVMSSGAVPLLRHGDARRLVDTAGVIGRAAATNNRYSSDVCAVSDAANLRDLPALPGDNALPRWLEERAGYTVTELSARDRLGLDLDTPLDVALAALSPACPGWLRAAAADASLEVPRLDELRTLADDPLREMLVFGRSGARTLRWLERNVRCRVRFLAEERGMRASTPLAIASDAADIAATAPVPRATLGLLLEQRGPAVFADVVAGLASGAIIDSRVLMAHRLGVDEDAWPRPADRFASDLHRTDDVDDPWLRSLTESVANSRLPILLGGHSLVGPGVRLALQPGGRSERRRPQA